MAEGVDNAAAAFQAEIQPQSPVADRSRDAETGRFTQVRERPEPMFAPRPLEGDPETGDLSDGGDDPRLAAHERKAADGWTDERDAEGTRQTTARRQRPGKEHGRDAGTGSEHAAADGRHAGAEAEPERLGDQRTGDDQDAEESDEGPSSEGPSEPDAESWQVIRNGKPVEQLEVTIDGRPQPVTLEECVKGYIREQTFHQRMSQVDQARQAVQGEVQTIGHKRQELEDKLTLADRILADMTPPEPDWDQEFAIDAKRARDNQKAFQSVYHKRAMIQQAMAEERAKEQQEYDKQANDYAVREWTQFVAESGFRNKQEVDEAVAMMHDYALKEGFSSPEIHAVYDRRMHRVLRKAALYDLSQAHPPKAVSPDSGKTLIPGSATPMGNAPRRQIDAAQKRLAKTGRLDDAALVMKQFIR
jgi:hypothetical protein